MFSLMRAWNSGTFFQPREAARLMGLPETYQLPANHSQAYQLIGDGVVLPVVRFLSTHLLEPLASTKKESKYDADNAAEGKR